MVRKINFQFICYSLNATKNSLSLYIDELNFFEHNTKFNIPCFLSLEYLPSEGFSFNSEELESEVLLFILRL